MLMEQIVRAQQGCSEDMEALIEKFEPILKKYSRKPFWEDARSDMTLAFIELVHALPNKTLPNRTILLIKSFDLRIIMVKQSTRKGAMSCQSQQQN